MIKRMFCCFCICIILSGCSVTKNDKDKNEFYYYTKEETESTLNDYFNDSRNSFEITEEVAVSIAGSIFQSMRGEKAFNETEVYVGESIEKGVFLISILPSPGEMLGGDFNIIIRKSDGAIINVWGGE